MTSYDYEYLCRSIGLDFSLFFFKHGIHIWPYMFGDRIPGVAMRGAAWEFFSVIGDAPNLVTIWWGFIMIYHYRYYRYL